MNGYPLTLAAFLLIGGLLCDLFGRRKVYLIGTVWFALASAACGLAADRRLGSVPGGGIWCRVPGGAGVRGGEGESGAGGVRTGGAGLQGGGGGGSVGWARGGGCR